MTYAAKKTRGKFVRKNLPNPINYFNSEKIKLTGNGPWCNALCPFHQDTTPSLRINVKKGAYRCMACGAHGGDVLAFHRHKYGLDFIQACKQLGAWVEVSR